MLSPVRGLERVDESIGITQDWAWDLLESTLRLVCVQLDGDFVIAGATRGSDELEVVETAGFFKGGAEGVEGFAGGGVVPLFPCRKCCISEATTPCCDCDARSPLVLNGASTITGAVCAMSDKNEYMTSAVSQNLIRSDG
jgi:hypothetical protein